MDGSCLIVFVQSVRPKSERPLAVAGTVIGDYAEIPEHSPFPAGEGPWRQKGHLYRGLFKNLEGYVEGGAAAAIERVEDAQVRAFLSQPFAAGGWYDLFPMITLVVQVARMVGIPYFRAVSDLSRMMAERDLNGVYRTLLRVVSPDFLAPRLPRIQGQYLDFGNLRVGETRPGYVEIFRGEHPLLLVHWYVAVVHGFLPLVLGHAGAKDVRVRWAPPVAEGSKFGFDLVTVRFEIHWT
jgi:hypothetical protein